MLPPVAVTLSACAAVLFVVRSAEVRPSLTLWGVLAGAVSVTLAGILIAAVAANRTARSVSDRIRALRRSSARGEADLRDLVETLRRGDGPPKRKPRSGPSEGADDFELLAADLARAHDGAVTAVVQASQLSTQAGSEQKLEVFVNLARRLQSLVHREISILDELENEIEDPDLLKGLFHVDHLATRIRRHAENLAVLGGAVSRRQWSNPVSMTEVLRSAIAEVEQYSRVKLVPPIDGTLRGHAVADVIHLLAELVENATVFSAPHTQVLLRANLVTSGLAVEVEDRGLGMPVGEQSRMNALLADPDQVNVASLLADGRIGLFVVSQLAKRHGIHVRLQTNIYGGVQAVLVVPQGLLGTEPGARGGTGVSPQPPSQARPQQPAQAPVPEAPQPRRRHASGGASAGSAGAGGAGGPAGSAGSAGTAAGSAGPAGPAGPDGSAGSGHGGQRGVGEVSQVSQGASRRQQAQAGGQGGAPRGNGDGPAPLPVRGARGERANPAEAVPGIRSDERRLVEENTVAPPTPRVSTVRGTMGKPQLPRRRAQEHIAPQLRDGPAPRQDSDTLAGHDPGLMAAFQRGIGLAETQQHMESVRGDAERVGGGYVAGGTVEAGHVEAGHMGAGPKGAGHVDGGSLDAEHMGDGYLDGRHMGGRHMGGRHMGGGHMDPGHMDPGHMGASHVDATRTASGHTLLGHTSVSSSVNVGHMDSAHTATTHGTTPAYTPSPHTDSDTTSSHPEPTRLDTDRSQPTLLRPTSVDALHMDVTPMTARPSMGASPMDPAHTTEPHPGPAPGTDHTTWPDGSAPAG
ncbi:sensor histidine kinase [Streptomyces ferrugineus]|uniref:histidine kinase n=1 Tax=Streptomyces ferrugineus TaxID=1413221 RepID=A0A7M2SZN7_9ACTN|nr:sensor histidine kinase [Streptomyces ferrugineus]